MSATIQKRYEYKISRNGTFLGLLQDVQSDFSYNQLIGTTFAQLDIVVSASADTASQPVSPILDETGAIITDEVGEAILEERPPDLVGDAADNILIRNDNDVVVYEFSPSYPNGLLVFQGYIAKWKALFGGDDNVMATVISHGQDLAHYLTPGGIADVVDQSQALGNAFDNIVDPGLGSGSYRRHGQTFTTGPTVTNISAIDLQVEAFGTGDYTLKLWNNVADFYNGGSPIGTIVRTIIASGLNADNMGSQIAVERFTFATPITLSPNSQYFMTLQGLAGSGDLNYWGSIGYANTAPYASGDAYRSTSGTAGFVLFSPARDLYFKTYYTTPSTTKTYTNSDPSTTLTAIMDYYISSGGSIGKQSGGYPLTGVIPAETTFKLNTVLEGIQKLIDLAPSDWYWYVDPADGLLYFNETSTTADHKLIKGRHIEMLQLEATKEDIANVTYFTGGDVGGGVNLFVNINDNVSLSNNRRGLVRVADNRETDTSVGQLILQNYIDQHDEQKYITQVRVGAATYDINSYNLGDVIGFEGFGNLVDNLLLQIVGVTRTPDNITLSLGLLPPRQTALTDQLARELSDVQTIDNPTTPS